MARTTEQFLAAPNGQKGPVLETLNLAKARQMLVDAQSRAKVDMSGIDVSNRTIEQDGLSVPVTIVRPQGVTGTLPVFTEIVAPPSGGEAFALMDRVLRTCTFLYGSMLPDVAPTISARPWLNLRIVPTIAPCCRCTAIRRSGREDIRAMHCPIRLRRRMLDR
ncbi:esterase [Burkholderia lata]|nr:esterase [Burkholderia lata]